MLYVFIATYELNQNGAAVHWKRVHDRNDILLERVTGLLRSNINHFTIRAHPPRISRIHPCLEQLLFVKHQQALIVHETKLHVGGIIVISYCFQTCTCNTFFAAHLAIKTFCALLTSFLIANSIGSREASQFPRSWLINSSRDVLNSGVTTAILLVSPELEGLCIYMSW